MLKSLRERCRGRTSAGFTLVEALVVMVIMSVVMMAVMSLFIPVVRSTAVQTQVSDVQANLRLGMGRMTKDLILAGLLVSPSVGAAVELSGGSPANTITIRSRTVGNAFGRVVSYNSGVLTLSDKAMVSAFPKGSKVGLFDPLSSASVGSTTYTVKAADYDAALGTLSLDPVVVVQKETVLLKIEEDAQLPLQTIVYQVNNGALERTINNNDPALHGSKQILARNVNSVTFTSDPATAITLTNPVRRVDITLVGQSVGLAGGGAESSTKDRQLQGSVALRNVF